VSHEHLVDRLFEILISGDRNAARAFVAEANRQGISAESLISDIYWPTYEMIERLYRKDQMTAIAHNLSTRLLRVLVDQTAQRLNVAAPLGSSVFAVCGPNDPDELAAQMAVDLLEARGFTVSFAGGGIASDEILAQVQESRPDYLLLFASAPGDLPGIRSMIDQIREIGAVRKMRVVVGGGVFNRAQGLAEEIGAESWASSPRDLADVMLAPPVPRSVESVAQNSAKKRRAKAA